MASDAIASAQSPPPVTSTSSTSLRGSVSLARSGPMHRCEGIGARQLAYGDTGICPRRGCGHEEERGQPLSRSHSIGALRQLAKTFSKTPVNHIGVTVADHDIIALAQVAHDVVPRCQRGKIAAKGW